MMNLFHSKIIKKEDAVYGGKKRLRINSTDNQAKDDENNEIDKVANIQSKELIELEQEIEQKRIQSQNEYEEMIRLAKEESLKIIEESKNNALLIEKKAYEEGHNQGLQNGYEDGYKEAYENNIEKAKYESEQIINRANNILFEAKDYVANYMKENKESIIKLSISIAEKVLKNKFEDTSCMDELLLNAINEYELKENFVVKVNPIYKDSLDKQILELKESHTLKGDVFILADELIEPGNVIIDTVNGRLVMGVDSVLDKIKEELL